MCIDDKAPTIFSGPYFLATLSIGRIGDVRQGGSILQDRHRVTGVLNTAAQGETILSLSCSCRSVSLRMTFRVCCRRMLVVLVVLVEGCVYARISDYQRALIRCFHAAASCKPSRISFRRTYQDVRLVRITFSQHAFTRFCHAAASCFSYKIML